MEHGKTWDDATARWVSTQSGSAIKLSFSSAALPVLRYKSHMIRHCGFTPCIDNKKRLYLGFPQPAVDVLTVYLKHGTIILDLVSRTASSAERANCIVLWPVWPPRTIKCNNSNNNNYYYYSPFLFLLRPESLSVDACNCVGVCWRLHSR
jgi:hypothetical protein